MIEDMVKPPALVGGFYICVMHLVPSYYPLGDFPENSDLVIFNAGKFSLFANEVVFCFY